MSTDVADMLEVGLESRACDCCGGADLEPVWANQSIVKRAIHTWRFPYNIAVCRTCGFCFASPSPRRADLFRYHAEGLTGYKGIGLPYSIDRRIEVLKRYASPGGVLAEVGGDAPGAFHKQCEALFGRQINVEIAEDSPADVRRIEDLAEGSLDVIAHYDVLEHIVEVLPFLRGCHRALKRDGVMVCEVPDIRLYPRNLLLLEFEHVNHFSVTTLGSLAQSVGLQLIEAGHVCSRPFGLLAVFRKGVPTPTRPASGPFEYLDALACLNGGLEQIRRNGDQIQKLRKRMDDLAERDQKVTLWGVTDLMRRLLDGYALPGTAVVVDSDPRRRTHLETEGLVVHQPHEQWPHLADSGILIICAPRYQREILESVAQATGRRFENDALAVLGTGPSGETLT